MGYHDFGELETEGDKLMENVQAVFMLVVSLLTTLGATGAAVWKFKPLQRGIILLISSALTKTLTPTIDKLTETTSKVLELERKVTEMENRQIDYFEDQEQALASHKAEIERRFELAHEKIESTRESQATGQATIKEGIADLKIDLRELREAILK